MTSDLAFLNFISTPDDIYSYPVLAKHSLNLFQSSQKHRIHPELARGPWEAHSGNFWDKTPTAKLIV